MEVPALNRPAGMFQCRIAEKWASYAPPGCVQALDELFHLPHLNVLLCWVLTHFGGVGRTPAVEYKLYTRPGADDGGRSEREVTGSANDRPHRFYSRFIIFPIWQSLGKPRRRRRSALTRCRLGWAPLLLSQDAQDDIVATLYSFVVSVACVMETCIEMRLFVRLTFQSVNRS